MAIHCWGHDPEAWGRLNRVQLYPDKLQTWILVTTYMGDNPQPDLIRYMVANRLHDWFDGGIFELPIPPLRVDHEPLEMGGATDIRIGDAAVTCPWLRNYLQTWASSLPGPLPLMEDRPIVYVPVTFAWRNPALTSMPWPTFRRNFIASGPCPVDNEFMLIYVGGVDAGELPPAPPPPPPRKSIPEEIGETIDNAINAAVPAWVGIALGTLAVGYLINGIASLASVGSLAMRSRSK